MRLQTLPGSVASSSFLSLQSIPGLDSPGALDDERPQRVEAKIYDDSPKVSKGFQRQGYD